MLFKALLTPMLGQFLPSLLNLLMFCFNREFSGKFYDWENFRDVFRFIIHRREDLRPIMKLHFLRNHLTSEALEKINSLSIMTER